MYAVVDLRKADYYNGFLQLLEQLTTVNANEITYEEFCAQFDKQNSKVFVVLDNGKVIGTATLLIEVKFIHKLSFVGHIEDVVVNESYRGRGIGKLLVDHCSSYAQKNGCYKVILDCDRKNVGFYNNCGFEEKSVQMSKYF